MIILIIHKTYSLEGTLVLTFVDFSLAAAWNPLFRLRSLPIVSGQNDGGGNRLIVSRYQKFNFWVFHIRLQKYYAGNLKKGEFKIEVFQQPSPVRLRTFTLGIHLIFL